MWPFSKDNPAPPAAPKTALPAHWQGRVEIRHSARARRIALRVDQARGKIWLIRPRRAGIDKALRFALENARWVEKNLPGLERPAAPAIGGHISVMGRPRKIVPAAAARVKMTDTHILVRDDPGMVATRLRRFLRAQARTIIEPLAAAKAAQLGITIGALRISDPKSRWGSCSSARTLSFSWRLVLCPPDILDYVVAHEVAHLKHMNHSKSFWACCAALCEYDAGAARNWLKKNGSALHHVL